MQNPLEQEPDPLLSTKRWRKAFAARSTGGGRLELFPLRHFLRGYGLEDFRSDAKAGVNVALLDFPQGMAYALIAGLPFFMGIYASAIAAFLGPLFASSRFIMLGPTNAIAVLTLSAFLTLQMGQAEIVAALPMLMLMVGALMLVGAFLRVAGVINYVSRSVVTGYITAAAFLIVIKQMKNVLGLEDLPGTATFIDALLVTTRHLGETDLPSLVIGAVTMGIYLFAKRFLRGLPTVAITLTVMYGVAHGCNHWLGWTVAPLSAEPLAAGHWPLSMPHFSFELFAQLAQPALAIAFLSLLESSSIAKTLAAQSGDTVNLNQQMVSMGVANIGCAFASGMPISGSLTRSALNQTSGARTPVASMMGAFCLAAGVFLLAPVAAGVPMPALSALVVVVGFLLLDRHNLRIVLGTTNSDAVVFMTTLIAGLIFPLDTAIYFGVLVSVLLFMKKAGTPVMKEFAFSESGAELPQSANRPALAMLHVEGDLFFGSSDIFLEQARGITADPNLRVIILRLRNAHHLDATCAMAIGQLVNFARQKGRHVLVSGAHPEVIEIFRNSGLLNIIGRENVFCEDPDNPTRSNSLSLKRAHALVGSEMNLRLFVRNAGPIETA